jgi:threonine/homoserine/homoserine lactone efflux protein
MVSLDQVLAFSLVALVVIAVPGPSVVFTVARALTYGRAVALVNVVGNSLGLLSALIIVVLGLGRDGATSDVF